MRNSLGRPFNGTAIVRLYNPAGGYDITVPAEKGEARFDCISQGDYIVEVHAPGYQMASEPIKVVNPMPSVPFFISLIPERPASAMTAKLPAQAVLSIEARIALDEALDALQEGELAKAESLQEDVRRLAPNSPDVPYLSGMLSLRRNNLSEAQRHFEKTIGMHHGHVAALSALGEVYLRRGEGAQAVTNLEQAVAADAESWQASGLLALAYVFQGEMEKARSLAERTVQLTDGKQPAFRLLLAVTLINLDEIDAAKQQLNSFLQGHPDDSEAAEARRLLREINAPASIGQPSSGGKAPEIPFTLTDNLLKKVGVLNVQRTASDWKPREVDAIDPMVASDVTCPLPEVIGGAGRQVDSLVAGLERISATEQISYEELSDKGKRTYSEDLTMSYIVSFKKVRPDVFSVDEFRTPMKTGESNRRVSTKGEAALALIFHSSYSIDYKMTCAGLGQMQGRPVWIVDFHQRPDRPARVSTYRTYRGLFGLKWKGRAWITANSYQIARLELDLIEPIPDIRLARDHVMVQYGPVPFQKTNSQLWLPHYFEIYLNIRGRWYHIRHALSDFRLFSVETMQKVDTPPKP